MALSAASRNATRGYPLPDDGKAMQPHRQRRGPAHSTPNHRPPAVRSSASSEESGAGADVAQAM